MITASQYLAQTSARLKGWYNNALIDYGVKGSAKVRIEGDTISIEYIENGVSNTWSMCFYVENQEELDYYFSVWAEEAGR